MISRQSPHGFGVTWKVLENKDLSPISSILGHVGVPVRSDGGFRARLHSIIKE
jgi:hypothetical protein